MLFSLSFVPTHTDVWARRPVSALQRGGVVVRPREPGAVPGADVGGAGGDGHHGRRRAGGARRRDAYDDGQLLPRMPGAGAHAGDAAAF